MDPLLFGMDGEVVAEALGTIVLLSLLIERVLSLIFEWRPLPLVKKFDKSDLKERIAPVPSYEVVQSPLSFDINYEMLIL